jgi:hypothetical protein
MKSLKNKIKGRTTLSNLSREKIDFINNSSLTDEQKRTFRNNRKVDITLLKKTIDKKIRENADVETLLKNADHEFLVKQLDKVDKDLQFAVQTQKLRERFEKLKSGGKRKGSRRSNKRKNKMTRRKHQKNFN